jgi:hypothetical protein
MRRPETRTWKAAERAVAEVLMRDWDPIGVIDVPEAQDEYDSYVPEFVALLVRNASDEEIANALYRIETVAMGMNGAPIEALQLVARKLRAVYAR